MPSEPDQPGKTEPVVALAGNQPAKKREVNDSHVIKESSAGSVKEVTKLDAVGQAGMQLAIGVGVLITIITVALVGHWIFTAPAIGIPSELTGKTPDETTKVIENMKAMSDLAADRSIKLFDTIVTKAFLPVFTAILGYIFGSRNSSQSKS